MHYLLSWWLGIVDDSIVTCHSGSPSSIPWRDIFSKKNCQGSRTLSRITSSLRISERENSQIQKLSPCDDNNKITLYFTILDEENFDLETTSQHHGSKTTTTKSPSKPKSTIGVTTQQTTDFFIVPEGLWDCTVLYFNFTKLSDIGDGICHDHLNHMHCNYDGGDCCLQNVNTSICSTCACLSDDVCKLSQTS